MGIGSTASIDARNMKARALTETFLAEGSIQSGKAWTWGTREINECQFDSTFWYEDKLLAVKDKHRVWIIKPKKGAKVPSQIRYLINQIRDRVAEDPDLTILDDATGALFSAGAGLKMLKDAIDQAAERAKTIVEKNRGRHRPRSRALLSPHQLLYGAA